MDEETTVEDDHIPFLKAGVPSLDIIDLDYPPGTPRRTRSTPSPRAACRLLGSRGGGAAGDRSAPAEKLTPGTRWSIRLQADCSSPASVTAGNNPAKAGCSTALPIDLGENLGFGQHRRRAASPSRTPDRRSGRCTGCRAAPARTPRSTSLTSARLRFPGGGRPGWPESRNRPRPSDRDRLSSTP